MPKKLTQEEFIERAKKVHGDKYDYSKVDYKNNKTKVCIICPEHGEFWMSPENHLNKNGCQYCSGHKLNTEIVVEKIRRVYGDKYDYSKVDYKNNSTKICIICPEHGEFWVTPGNLLFNKEGCPICGRLALTKTTEQFIADARKVHGDKYDYSKVEYVNSSTKVCIICPEHGEFWQTPSSHLRGRGCPVCSDTTKTTEQFIADARKVHGDKYDYSKVEYVNAFTKVCIICPEHGEFWQRPSDHLRGFGCNKCQLELKIKTTEQFIADARKVHGDKYDYSKVEYKGSKIKVCIICPEHGEFWVSPNMHLCHSNGCNKCNLSKGEKSIYLFFKSNEINFIYQYRADWLKNQSLDFFLPDYNLGIEFDGIQHYEPIDFSGSLTEEETLKEFEIIQERDKRKDEKCVANGVKLFRIRYDEDIEESLTKILKLYNIEILGDK